MEQVENVLLFYSLFLLLRLPITTVKPIAFIKKYPCYYTPNWFYVGFSSGVENANFEYESRFFGSTSSI